MKKGVSLRGPDFVMVESKDVRLKDGWVDLGRPELLAGASGSLTGAPVDEWLEEGLVSAFWQ